MSFYTSEWPFRGDEGNGVNHAEAWVILEPEGLVTERPLLPPGGRMLILFATRTGTFPDLR